MSKITRFAPALFLIVGAGFLVAGIHFDDTWGLWGGTVLLLWGFRDVVPIIWNALVAGRARH